MIKQNSEKQYFLVLEQKNKVTITIPIEKSPIFNNLEERFKNKPMSLAAICAFTIQFDSAANLRHHLIENQLIPGFEDNMHYASVLTTTNFSIADQSGMPITNTPLFGSYVQQVGFLINDPVSSILELFNSKDFPSIKIGRAFWVKADCLERFLSERHVLANETENLF